MKGINAKVREWGSSVGIVIPKETAVAQRIKAGDTITVHISKKNPIKKTFGTHKFKKTTQELVRESEAEAWDE